MIITDELKAKILDLVAGYEAARTALEDHNKSKLTVCYHSGGHDWLKRRRELYGEQKDRISKLLDALCQFEYEVFVVDGKAYQCLIDSDGDYMLETPEIITLKE